jgi:CDP-paratose 2-epimerase
MLEAIALCERIAGKKLQWTYAEANRTGDHVWWISDVSRFQSHYPDWRFRHGLEGILVQIRDELLARS